MVKQNEVVKVEEVEETDVTTVESQTPIKQRPLIQENRTKHGQGHYLKTQRVSRGTPRDDEPEDGDDESRADGRESESDARKGDLTNE